jgi:manganese/iron transport system substrate-binding protein
MFQSQQKIMNFRLQSLHLKSLRLSQLCPTLAIAASFSLLASCTASNPKSADPAATGSPAPIAVQNHGIKVVAANSVLCDMTQQIAQATIALTCLIKAGEDPHVYAPTPDDRKAIETAKLILYGGYDMEPDITKLVKATSNPAPKIAVHELAVPQPLMGEPDHHAEPHDMHEKSEAKESNDPDQGAKAEAPDPHVWHSAQNGIQMVRVIQEQLSKVAPENAAIYAKNAKTLTDRLTKVDGWIKEAIATIPVNQRKLVTTHEALGYYADAYQIPVEGALQGVSTDEKPTAERLKTLVDEIKATQVPTIFAEVTANPKLIETVAKEANVKLSEQKLYADGIGESGSSAATYDQMLISNTKAIVTGLGGTLTNPTL